MDLSKLDLINWRQHPVTMLFLEETLNTIDQQMQMLSQEAGLDSLKDRYRVGLVQGLAALADWEPNTIEESVDAESEGT